MLIAVTDERQMLFLAGNDQCERLVLQFQNDANAAVRGVGISVLIRS